MKNSNQALHIAHKRVIWAYIKQLGEAYGEDSEFISEYAKDVYNSYKQDLETAINCFQSLLDQSKLLGKSKISPSLP